MKIGETSFVGSGREKSRYPNFESAEQNPHSRGTEKWVVELFVA